MKNPAKAGFFDHIWLIIAWPNPEHDTCVAFSIKRAKSYVTVRARIVFCIDLTIRSAASASPVITLSAIFW